MTIVILGFDTGEPREHRLGNGKLCRAQVPWICLASLLLIFAKLKSRHYLGFDFPVEIMGEKRSLFPLVMGLGSPLSCWFSAEDSCQLVQPRLHSRSVELDE